MKLRISLVIPSQLTFSIFLFLIVYFVFSSHLFPLMGNTWINIREGVTRQLVCQQTWQNIVVCYSSELVKEADLFYLAVVWFWHVVFWSVLALYYGLMHCLVHAFRRYNIMSGSKQSVKFFNQHGSIILIMIQTFSCYWNRSEFKIWICRPICWSVEFDFEQIILLKWPKI